MDERMTVSEMLAEVDRGQVKACKVARGKLMTGSGRKAGRPIKAPLQGCISEKTDPDGRQGAVEAERKGLFCDIFWKESEQDFLMV